MAQAGSCVQAEAASPQIEHLIARFLPSFCDLVFVVVLFGGLLTFQGALLGTDGDVGWDLRLGAITLMHGLPRMEPLLETMRGTAVVHWEWLAQVLYALADRIGGLNGVVGLAALLIAGTGAGLVELLRARRMPLLAALPLALLGLAMIATAWTARAELFSLPLTLWWCAWLRAYWRDGSTKRLFAFPVMMALWANLHAGFMLALLSLALATGVAWLWPRGRGRGRPLPLTIALGASALATLCTPWGLALYGHLLAFARDPLVAAYTREYQRPGIGYWPLWLLLALLAALALGWLAAPRRSATALGGSANATTALDLALVALWTALALTYVRFVPFWPLVALPALAAALQPRWPSVERWLADAPRWLAALWRRGRRIESVEARAARGVWSGVASGALLVVLLAGGYVPGTQTHLLDARFNPHAFPVAAVARLKATGLPVGLGFSTYDWGGYLEYALPGTPVFIDSRSDVYGERLLRDYLHLMSVDSGWQGLLDEYRIAWALLPANAPLTHALAHTAGWRCHVADTQGVAVLCARAGVASTGAPKGAYPSL